jgi:bacterioferritin-associated ferredoxin
MTDKIICYCTNVPESQIVKAISNGAHTLKEIQKATNACTGNQCKKLSPKGHCYYDDIMEIQTRETGIEPPAANSCCCN